MSGLYKGTLKDTVVPSPTLLWIFISPPCCSTIPEYFQTLTAMPTLTSTPTRIPRPMYQLTAVPDSVAVPEPIFLSGEGDSIVDVEKWDGRAIAEISYSGDHLFRVKNFYPNDENLDMLVNTIGTYRGAVPIDFLPGEQTTLSISSPGKWAIELK